MSASEKKSLGMGRLVVEAPLGTTIEILNSGLVQLETGTTSLSKDLEDGVYAVNWRAGDKTERWMVRIKAGETSRVTTDLPGRMEAELPPNNSRMEIAQWISRLKKPLHGAEIFIAVLAPEQQVKADLTRSIRLREASAPTTTTSVEPLAEKPDERGNWAAVRYAVQPGCYVLTFETFERRLAEMTVYVPKGRVAFILLPYGQTSIVEGQSEDGRIRKRRGIDAANVIILAPSFVTSASQIVENLATAETLLHGLKSRERMVDPESAKVLLNEDADIMLKLYAAAGLLALYGNVLQRLETSVKASFENRTALRPDATTVAELLYNQLKEHSDWPDVTCLGWQLSVADGEHQSIAVLPMLEICWRWAASQSVRGSNSSSLNQSMNDAVSRADPAASPWMVTGTAAAGTGPKVEEFFADIAPDLLELSAKVAEAVLDKTRQSISSKVAPASANSAINRASLSPATDQLVQAVLSAGRAAGWKQAASDLLPRLAASLAEPVSSLGPIIKNAIKEISEAVQKGPGPAEALWNSDPHKGKFGGLSESDGVRLTLESFQQQDGLDFLALNLTVIGTRTPELSGIVTFYLHPTFSPHTVTVPVIKGRADFTCYAMGAFTVGVETQDGRRLELDLAEDERLPVAFLAN
jgi:hypothetical protein